MRVSLITIIGLVLLAIGGIGSVASCILELIQGEPTYLALMKIFSFLIGVGGVLFGVKREGQDGR